MGAISIMDAGGDDWIVTARDGMFVRVTAPRQNYHTMLAACEDCETVYDVIAAVRRLNKRSENCEL